MLGDPYLLSNLGNDLFIALPMWSEMRSCSITLIGVLSVLHDEHTSITIVFRSFSLQRTHHVPTIRFAACFGVRSIFRVNPYDTICWHMSRTKCSSTTF